VGPRRRSPAVVSEATPRLAYVDNLRVLLVTGVFLIHVCEVFNPWDDWHIQNDQRSRLVGEVAVWMAPWIMPLIMLLAGVSAWYSLRTRTNTEYVRERLTRVFLPLVVGTLVLVPPQVYLERKLDGSFDRPFWAFLPHFFDGIYPSGNLSWHHLWFLAHLFAYSVVALPLFRYWQRSDRSDGEHRPHWFARVCSRRLGLLWLAVPLVLERQLLWGLFPERHMLASDWSNHAVLFVAYVYGFILAGEPTLGAAIDTQWPRLLIIAAVFSAALVVGTWTGVLPGRLPPPYVTTYIAFWTIYAGAAWAWMVAVIGIARRWLSGDRPAARYGRAMAYGWYIVHQPVIIAVAFVIVQQKLTLPVKFVLVLVLSLAGTIIGTELLRLVPGAGRALIQRPRGQPDPTLAVAART
jgi:Acyltransferase family